VDDSPAPPLAAACPSSYYFCESLEPGVLVGENDFAYPAEGGYGETAPRPTTGGQPP